MKNWRYTNQAKVWTFQGKFQKKCNQNISQETSQINTGFNTAVNGIYHIKKNLLIHPSKFSHKSKLSSLNLRTTKTPIPLLKSIDPDKGQQQILFFGVCPPSGRQRGRGVTSGNPANKDALSDNKGAEPDPLLRPICSQGSEGPLII